MQEEVKNPLSEAFEQFKSRLEESRAQHAEETARVDAEVIEVMDLLMGWAADKWPDDAQKGQVELVGTALIAAVRLTAQAAFHDGINLVKLVESLKTRLGELLAIEYTHAVRMHLGITDTASDDIGEEN